VSSIKVVVVSLIMAVTEFASKQQRNNIRWFFMGL
jgi:hypothetical protein